MNGLCADRKSHGGTLVAGPPPHPPPPKANTEVTSKLRLYVSHLDHMRYVN
jgi:hypothetical protein